MSLHAVRPFLAEHAPDLEILEKSTSTATVAQAAAAHGVQPGQTGRLCDGYGHAFGSGVALRLQKPI
jgi:hypothetical protein